MANPNIVNVSTITLENQFTTFTSETTTDVLSTVPAGEVYRVKEVRVSDNSALTTDPGSSTALSTDADTKPAYFTLSYYDASATATYTVVSNYHVPVASGAVLFDGCMHVTEGDKLTLTFTDDGDPASADIDVMVTYEVLS